MSILIAILLTNEAGQIVFKYKRNLILLLILSNIFIVYCLNVRAQFKPKLKCVNQNNKFKLNQFVVSPFGNE